MRLYIQVYFGNQHPLSQPQTESCWALQTHELASSQRIKEKNYSTPSPIQKHKQANVGAVSICKENSHSLEEGIWCVLPD